MRRRTKVEMTQAQVAKCVRAAIRLKYSLQADEEINDRLPSILDEFELALSTGTPWALPLGDILDET